MDLVTGRVPGGGFGGYGGGTGGGDGGDGNGDGELGPEGDPRYALGAVRTIEQFVDSAGKRCGLARVTFVSHAVAAIAVRALAGQMFGGRRLKWRLQQPPPPPVAVAPDAPTTRLPAPMGNDGALRNRLLEV